MESLIGFSDALQAFSVNVAELQELIGELCHKLLPLCEQAGVRERSFQERSFNRGYFERKGGRRVGREGRREIDR